MLRQWLILLLCAVLTITPLLSAAGTEEADTHGNGPDIFSGNLGTAIFTLAVFVVLLLILGKWAWGPILSGLQTREEHIRKSIEDAEKSRLEAEQALADYKRKLADANDEAQVIIERGRADAVHLAEELKQNAQAESQKLLLKAQRGIESARDQALRQICTGSVEMAAEMAAAAIGESLRSEDHRVLIQESLNKLQQDLNNN